MLFLSENTTIPRQSPYLMTSEPGPPPSPRTCATAHPPCGRTTIPDGTSPYFLKADGGPKYFLNAQSCSPLTLARNTHGHFALSVLAGIGPLERYPGFTCARREARQGPFHARRKLRLASHSLFRVIEGKVRFDLEDMGEEQGEVVSCGESVMVPAGRAFSYAITSAYARMYMFSGKGGGLEEVFVRAGRLGRKGEVVGGNEDALVEESTVDEVVKALGGEIV